MNDDAELLRQYAQSRSEEAFAELVRRHLDLVYTSSLRQLGGDTHRAKDVTQIVFTDLARKASILSHHTALTGWLYTSTRFAAAKAIRAEQRRQTHEREAQAMNTSSSSSTDDIDWDRLRPVLDDVMCELNSLDRDAVLLRFFEGRAFAEVGKSLRLTEDAARMRVSRALDRMRGRLARRGITSTVSALSVLLSSQVGSAAPVWLAAEVTGTALGAASNAGATGAGLIQLMSATKLAVGTAGFLGIVAILGTITIGVGTYELQRAFFGAQAADATNRALGLELAMLRSELATSNGQNVALQVQVDQLGDSRTRTSVFGSNSGLSAGPNARIGRGTTAQSPAVEEQTQLYFETEKINNEIRAAQEFRKLSLSEVQLEQYAGLETDALKGTMGTNAQVGASAAGMSVAAYKAQVQSTLQNEIQALVGEQAYAQLQQDNASPQTPTASVAIVQQLASYLATGTSPLNSKQANQLLQVLAANQAAIDGNQGLVPDTVIADAQGFLLPSQIAGWQRMQSVRQTYQAMLNSPGN